MSRRLEDLHADVAELARQLIERAAGEGIVLRVTYTLRSREEQLALWMQGRVALRVVNSQRAACGLPPLTEAANRRTVTHAKPGHSLHESGRAFDVVPLRDVDGDGDLDAEWESPHWSRIGELGEQLGLFWGGRWIGKKRDRPHFEKR